jgi:hypothetical protein
VAQQIVIDIVAETKKLTQGLDDTNKQLGGLDKNIKAAAKSAVALASAFVLKQGISFLKDGIDEAKDAAAAMRAATATFGAGSDALKKITDDATKFGKEIAVDNDELIKLATQLGSRLPKDIQASSVELVKTFKDVEAFTGGAINAEAAGAKLAKAFADGGLKAGELNKIFPGLNQSIYDQAEALSKSGKNQEAVNLLLAEGAKVYGDAAAKNVDATQRFNVALDNFKETLGTKVLPILEKGINFLTDLLEAFDKLPTPVQNFSLGLLALVGIGGPLLSFIANIKTAATTLGILTVATEGTTVATNLMSLAMKAIPIMAVIALIALLIANWDDVSAAAKKVWEAVNKWWGSIYEDIKDFAGKAKKWLEDNWPLILGVLTGPFGLFVAFLVKHKDEIVTKLTEAWDAAKAVVAEKVEAIFSTVMGWFYAIRDYIGNLFKKGKDTIFSAIEDGWNAVKDTISTVMETIFVYLGTIWLKIALLIIDNIKKIVTGSIEKFTELKDAAIDQFNKLKDSASTIWNSIKQYIVDVATNIKNKLGEVYGFMVEVGKDIARGIMTGLGSMTLSFGSFLKNWVNTNIPLAVRKILGIASPSKVMMEIGQYAVEGLYQGMGIRGPVGIQMPQLNVAGGAAAGVNITINAGLGTDPVALGREVQKALNSYGKYNA